jgi:hypothetical protein
MRFLMKIDSGKAALAAASLAATVLLLVPGNALAYKTLKNSQCYGETRWFAADLPVKYFINNAGSADITGESVFTSINNAFNTWTTPSCSYFTVNYLGKTSDKVYSGDLLNMMEWIENVADWPPEVDNNAIAFTMPLIMINGRILEADIQYNGVNFKWSTTGTAGRMDVETIALHELGHVIGLADLYDNTSCYVQKLIMCGVNNGETKRSLKTDDQNGDCYLYPKGKFGPCTTDSDCTSGQVCSAQVAGSGETRVVCIDPVGKALPGAACTDTYNFPSWSGQNSSCRNLLCLESGICSAPCSDTSQCAHNMVCGDAQVNYTDKYTTADYKGCTLPGARCNGKTTCSGGKVWAVMNIADVTLMSVCVSPIGAGQDGNDCSKWSDCGSGACVDGKCVALCGDCGGCPNGYGCETHTVAGEGGKQADFPVCILGAQPPEDGGMQNPDGGVNPGDDSGVKPGDDSGTQSDSGNGSDGSVSADSGGSGEDGGGECTCDLTYACDPDCSCDPECQDQPAASSGCSCSSVGL